MIISVFKTSLNENESLHWLIEELAGNPLVRDWNIDFEDCDRILRVVSSSQISAEITSLFRLNGHHCIELN